MHQEIICDLINGLNRGLRKIYDQVWPHQDEPQDLSIISNKQDDSKI